MNKKRICYFLLLCAILSLCACGGDNKGESNPTKSELVGDKETSEKQNTKDPGLTSENNDKNSQAQASTINTNTDPAIAAYANSAEQDLNIMGLNFDSTEADVTKKLGKPTDLMTAQGISTYRYSKDYQYGNTITFINGTLANFIVSENTWGVSAGAYKNSKYNKQEVLLDESDIGLSVAQVIKKFGYPDNTYVFNSSGGHYGSMYFYFVYSKEGKDNEIVFWGEDKNNIRARQFTITNDRWIFLEGLKIGDGIDSFLKKLYLPENIRAMGVESDDTKTAVLSKITDIIQYEYIKLEFDSYKKGVVEVYFDVNGNSKNINWIKYDYPKYNIAAKNENKETVKFDKNTIVDMGDRYLSGCEFENGREGLLKRFGNPDKALMRYFGKEGYAVTYFYNGFSADIKLPIDSDDNSLDGGMVTSYRITGEGIPDFRGLQVGDDVNKLLEVVPCNNKIDFTKVGDQYIYTLEETPENVDGNISDKYSGVIESTEPNSGTIYYGTIYWEIYLNYKDGRITEIGYSYCMD